MIHTSEPWITDNEIVMDDDGIPCILIYGPDGPGNGRVAMAYAECGNEQELKGNANLITVAPELKKVCQALVQADDETYTLESFYLWLEDRHFIDLARKLIANL
jgi:hypothetical protein